MYNIYNQLVSEQIYVERYSLMKVVIKNCKTFYFSSKINSIIL